MQGTSFKLAALAALHLLSPAIISYLSSFFLTTIGCIIPYCSIESFRSSRESFPNSCLGWLSLGFIKDISISNIESLFASSLNKSASGSSGISADNPFPRPLFLKPSNIPPLVNIKTPPITHYKLLLL